MAEAQKALAAVTRLDHTCRLSALDLRIACVICQPTDSGSRSLDLLVQYTGTRVLVDGNIPGYQTWTSYYATPGGWASSHLYLLNFILALK